MNVVVHGLKKQSWIDDIILFNNFPSTVRPDGIKVITSDLNFRCLVRHKLAEMLPGYDHFVFQDDDLTLKCDIGDIVVPRLSNEGQYAVLGAFGRELGGYSYTTTSYTSGTNVVCSPNQVARPVDIVKGRFHIIPKIGISHMENHSDGFNTTHLKLEDDIRANVIMQYRMQKPSFVLPITQHFQELKANDAIWKQPSHTSNRNLAIKEAFEAGWVPI